jgi:uncharacterized PurR-regulated membrane protein YhhQ (DUF165 family)
MKIATKGKWLWTRTISSTILGQGIDSVVALTISYWGIMPFSAIAMIIAGHWPAKIAYEAIATPLTYYLVNYLKRKEQIDVYDYSTDFNPLKVS